MLVLVDYAWVPPTSSQGSPITEWDNGILVDNHTSARGIMGLMLPKGTPMQPKGRRLLG